MVTGVGTDADQSTVTLGSGPGEKTVAVGRGPGEEAAGAEHDCTSCMYAQDGCGPDTGTAGTAGQSTAGADAVESRPGAGTASRSPGPAP